MPPKASSWMNSRRENPCEGAVSAGVLASASMESSFAQAELRLVPHQTNVPSGSTTQKDCQVAVPSIAAVDTGPTATPPPNGTSVVPRSIGAVSTRESAADAVASPPSGTPVDLAHLRHGRCAVSHES